jgi:PERQ amino acid-rich with GYF domain-containing protein
MALVRIYFFFSPTWKDVNANPIDQPAQTMPRKLSLSSPQGPLGSPRDSGLPSPRTRGPLAPGFDGILNSGETWVSRRRASESGTRLSSGVAPRADDDAEQQSASRLKIDEQEEELYRHSESIDTPDLLGDNVSPQSLSAPSGNSQGPEPFVVDNAASPSMNGTERPTSPTFHSPTHSAPAESIPAQPLANSTPVTAASQPVTNPASIEWTYLDPQGHVQGKTQPLPNQIVSNQLLFLGPFRAEVMQKWYEEGYFVIDLLMRRVNLDEVWTPVGELAQRAGGERVFFFNFDAPAVPPGLSRHRESSRDPVQRQRETNGYNAPYQPVPTRSVHPSTLDSYFASSSPASNSPSSSFGAGQFGNNSPDPASFGGLVVSPMSSTDPPIGPRSGNVADPAFVGVRRTGYADAHFEQGFNVRAGLSSTGAVRTSSMDSYSFNSSIPSQPPWTSSNSVHSAPLSIRTNSYDHKGPSPFTSHLSTGTGLDPAYPGESSLTRGLAVQQEPLGQTYGNVTQRDIPRLGSRDLYQLDQRSGLGLGGFDGTPSVSPFDSPVQHQPFPQSPSMNLAPTSQQAGNALIPPTLSLSQPTWNDTTESAPTRTGLSPFDTTTYPTSRNTTSTRTAPPPPAPSWAPIKQPTPSESSQSPWFNAPQGVTDDGWGHVPGPHSLTVSNLTQHTQQHESGEVFSRDGAGALDSPLEPTSLQDDLPQPVQSSSIPVPPEPSQQLARPGRKFSVQTNLAQPTSPTSLTPAAAQFVKEPTPLPSAVSVPTKPVWSTEDDKKKSIGGPTSLREIQEMEAKKQEARKAAERERSRASATTTAPVSEDPQTFTASWGLPTSQVGAKTSSKDTPGVIVPSASASTPASVTLSSPTQPPPVAVWTTTQKSATKKSMRDILDEEERRKKAAFKEPIAANAPRRAYAETTSKVRRCKSVGTCFDEVRFVPR